MINDQLSPLFTGKFGSGGAGNMTRFLLALLAFSVQGFVFSGHIALELSRVSAWMPLVIGLLFLAMNLAYGKARGEIMIFPDRLTLNRQGKMVSVPLDKIAGVRLDKNHFAVFDGEGKMLARVFHPDPIQCGGLLWLLVQYRQIIPAEALRSIKMDIKVPENRMAVRIFLHDNGEDHSSDPGFVTEAGGLKWFFPIEDAQALHYRRGGNSSVTQALVAVVPPMRLEPSPALLPMYSLVNGITSSVIPSSIKSELLDTLAGEHGGMRLVHETGDGNFQEDFDGRKVEIVIPRQ